MSSKLLIFNYLIFCFYLKLKFILIFELNKIWKINFLLPVGFEPTTSGFREEMS